VGLAASACFNARSDVLLSASRVLVIATLSVSARVPLEWGCVPMISTLRKEVAIAIPAHAADALVDLMSVLTEEANAVCSRRQYS